MKFSRKGRNTWVFSTEEAKNDIHKSFFTAPSCWRARPSKSLSRLYKNQASCLISWKCIQEVTTSTASEAMEDTLATGSLSRCCDSSDTQTSRQQSCCLFTFHLSIVGKLQHHGPNFALYTSACTVASWCYHPILPPASATKINLQFYLIWMRKELESKLDETWRRGEPITHQPHFPTKWLFLEATTGGKHQF